MEGQTAMVACAKTGQRSIEVQSDHRVKESVGYHCLSFDSVAIYTEKAERM